MLIIEPKGGLANRMRVIASAIKLQQFKKCKAICFWAENNELNASFNELFESIDGINMIKKPSYYRFIKSINNKSFLKKNVCKLVNKFLGVDMYIRDQDNKDETWIEKINLSQMDVNKRNIYINTCEEFYENNDMFNKFIVNKEIESQIISATKKIQ